MVKIYGSMQCPDCVLCLKELENAGIRYEYLDFSDNLKNLKEFLQIRDQNPVFDSVKEQGKIGIPAIVTNDGSVMLDWSSLT